MQSTMNFFVCRPIIACKRRRSGDWRNKGSRGGLSYCRSWRRCKILLIRGDGLFAPGIKDSTNDCKTGC